MLGRLADLCYRRRWLVIATWLVLLVAATAANSAWGGDYFNGGRLEGTDSQEAYDLLEARFPAQSGESATVVFSVDDGTVADHQAAIDAYLAELPTVDFIAGYSGPFDGPGQVSADGTVAFATVDLIPYEEIEEAGIGGDVIVTHFEGGAEELASAGVDVDFSGYWFIEGGIPATELLGLVAAGIILLLSFGSILAAGLPLATAVIGVGIGLGAVGLWSLVVPTADFTVQVASMMAIGVGIDYALFIVTRVRELRRDGCDMRTATVGAVSTAGRAVVFAGLTVMVSLLGMLLINLDLLDGLAIGSATAIGVAVLAAITLLPALLSLTGKRLRPLAGEPGAPTARGFWYRWSRQLQSHPVLSALAGLTVLLVVAAPVLVLRLGAADSGSDAEGTTTREAYDLLAEGFGPGFNGPLLVVADAPDPTRLAPALEQLTAELSATDGIAQVLPPALNEAGDTAIMTVVPTTGPEDEATVELIEQIRDDHATVDGVDTHIGGATASNVDFATFMGERLPWFVAAVLVCSFLLLLLSFRSVLVPLKAVIVNLLSIGAAYGVMVAVFQWGWFSGPLGTGGGAPIEPWAPMMLFAIVFGLSMDYEVFLLSRIRERYVATGDNAGAVADGVAATARVISAAAAIMVCVFGLFVFGDLRAIKLIGLGLATAVFIDATVVRLVLVPATMELLGDSNWWLPRWLDRILPTFEVEGHVEVPVPQPTRAVDADAPAVGHPEPVGAGRR
jgi:RND superfamily putative drug exporter